MQHFCLLAGFIDDFCTAGISRYSIPFVRDNSVCSKPMSIIYNPPYASMLPVTIARKVMARGIIKHLKRMYAGAPDELHILHIQRMQYPEELHIPHSAHPEELHILPLHVFVFLLPLHLNAKSSRGGANTPLTPCATLIM